MNQLICNALADTVAEASGAPPDRAGRRRRSGETRPALRLVLAANLVAILFATAVAVALLVVALTRLA
jgi:hypothetical protein